MEDKYCEYLFVITNFILIDYITSYQIVSHIMSYLVIIQLHLSILFNDDTLYMYTVPHTQLHFKYDYIDTHS